MPASILERDVLPTRIPGYRPEDLDTLCAAGEVVWVGHGALGERDGRVALYLADSLPLLLPPREEGPRGAVHARLREHLEKGGASFFGELMGASGSGLVRDTLDALWNLVWAGEVTSDSPAALRAFLSSRQARAERRPRAGAFRSRRQVPPSGVGRFSLVPVPRRLPTATERLAAIAEQLLSRHGVLTRDAVVSEEVAGGFAAVYPVLRALEEAGRVRRGYFVAGLGGLQFARPGALERLRALREPDEEPQAVVVAAADPGNPYGAALAWPRTEEARMQRAAGAHLVLVDGRPAAWVGRGGRVVVPLLPAEEPDRSRIARATASALRGWAEASGRSALGWDADGPSLATGPLGPFLTEAGLVRSGPGFRVEAASPALAEEP